MRYVCDEKSRREYVKFLEHHPAGHFLQSPEWAGVKTNWKNEILLTQDARGRVRGAMSFLIRPVPLFGNLIYCPRGPVCDPWDRETLSELTVGCWELMDKYNAFGVRLEPDVSENDGAFRANMTALGWKFRPAGDALDTVQPRSLFRLDLRGKTEEEIFSGFHKKLRYNIRLAQRHGVEVTEGTREDLKEFAALSDVTARRDGFLGRSIQYYRRMWDSLGPDKISLLMARAGGETLAAGLFIHYSHKTWYAYGASSDEKRNMMACHLLQWEAIRRALSRGDRLYDLRGYLENEETGLYRFKSQFGADVARLVGETYLTDHPIKYALARRAERLLRKTYRVRSYIRKKFK